MKQQSYKIQTIRNEGRFTFIGWINGENYVNNQTYPLWFGEKFLLKKKKQFEKEFVKACKDIGYETTEL